MRQLVECATQADVDRVAAEGNVAVVRSGRFVAWRADLHDSGLDDAA